jgi:hypothetical protein
MTAGRIHRDGVAAPSNCCGLGLGCWQIASIRDMQGAAYKAL